VRPQPSVVTGLSVGCVLRVDHGIYDLLCGAGRLRVTLGGPMLAAMARDPMAGPCPGDWCEVRSWPDGPYTLERLLTPHPAVAR
jgi:ribosome biogenesis GTPase